MNEIKKNYLYSRHAAAALRQHEQAKERAQALELRALIGACVFAALCVLIAIWGA